MTTNTTTKALVLTAAAVLAGSGAVATAATSSAHSGPGDPVIRDVARHVLDSGAPGYMTRIDNGRGVALSADGVADRETGRELRATDQFEIGSNTKTFMSALTLQLVDRGQVDLDAPIEQYLPGVVPNGRNITVRMLLNHTSGLFSYTADEKFAEGLTSDPQRVWTEDELLKVAFAHEPDFAPGTAWNYSNTNYTLIGILLQEVTGKSLPDLVQQRIARPLGLKNTYFPQPRATDTGPGYAHGYAVSFASGKPSYADTSTWPIGGWGGAAGAIISDQRDLSRFFSGLLKGKLFSDQQLNEMKETVELPAEFPIRGGYGLGLFHIDSACGPVWGHGGDTNGHHSTAVATEDGRRTAVSDTTAGPSDLSSNPGAERFAQVAFAAQDVTTCKMLGKPVPQTVLDALHGRTPVAAR
ncbi:serine hydrolase [Kineosporia sp. NBRC 101677]|uniref:serine hydrolase domain-containing protein n=1 Tax=Kineosporia sp. NBRC 101677 TaxID=3032197 RepID=UPI0024A0F64D|nr:serine hydrolase domain-containing protein [Kineosporia sp. NBRC 101677]GLY19469.1 serine hydrolase [Kineosporia sp. NBRC 101677]